jgi:hypothetical protein
MYLFNTSDKQNKSAYLAAIRYVNIVGEIAALLYIAVTWVDTFS